MRKFLLSFVIFFLSFICLVGCEGITIPYFSQVPEDGGMDQYDSQFISLKNELNDPLKLENWLQQNTQWVYHLWLYTPYEFYLKKKGDCADYAVFNCYILNYHGYDTYSVQITYKNILKHPQHVIAVFKNNRDWYSGTLYEYSFFSVDKLRINGEPLNHPLKTIKDCVEYDTEVNNYYLDSDEEKYEIKKYEIHPWYYFSYHCKY